MFEALYLSNEAGFDAQVKQLSDQDLPADHDVLLRVDYSCINYKDALAVTNRAPVVRRWPLVPGIDCVGVVEHSDSAAFKAGDEVILNGWGVGEVHWGGLAQRARLKGDWLIKKPASLTGHQAMSIGTAGYTAMLCVMALEKHGIGPDSGEVLVTGASGGVGSTAISLLAKRGYQVIASTGKLAESDYLQRLGAAQVIDRSALGESGKPLQKERYAAAIDCVGSTTLANVCAQLRYGGAVAACGLAQGMDFPASVAPFILRGVTLYGIDSVMAPASKRTEAWRRLADEIDPSMLDLITTTIGLRDVVAHASKLLAGQVRGRIVVDVNK